MHIIYVDGGKNAGGGYGSFACYELPSECSPPKQGSTNLDIHAALYGAEPLHMSLRFTLVPPPRIRFTNNLAEAMSLYTALTWVVRNRLLEGESDGLGESENDEGTEPLEARLFVFMDSQIVVRQLSGVCRTHNTAQANVYTEIYNLLGERVSRVMYVWTPGALIKASALGH